MWHTLGVWEFRSLDQAQVSRETKCSSTFYDVVSYHVITTYTIRLYNINVHLCYILNQHVRTAEAKPLAASIQRSEDEVSREWSKVSVEIWLEMWQTHRFSMCSFLIKQTADRLSGPPTPRDITNNRTCTKECATPIKTPCLFLALPRCWPLLFRYNDYMMYYNSY